MTVFRARGRQVWTVKVPTPKGRWLSFSTGTKHLTAARRIERMVDHLGPRGERGWDVLAHVLENKLSVAELYDRYEHAGRDVARLRLSLSASDIEPMVQQFLDSCTCTEDTKAHYRALIRRLIAEGAPFPSEYFTAERLQRLIDDMRVSSATRRKAGAAFRAFGNWLVRRGVMSDNPMRHVLLPRPNAPRTLFLETADATKLAEAMPSPYRELSALLAGSGIEVSTALKLCVRDVDTQHREIRAQGTKSHARDRVVRVADWAWDYVARTLADKQPDDLLFPDIPDRWVAGDMHRATIKKLAKKFPVYTGYTMRDHRHTYAVRAMRAGAPADLIARQLGHASPTLVLTVYGRFQPSQAERDRWERAATAMDHERQEARRQQNHPQGAQS